MGDLELGAAYELAVDAIDGVLFSENPHRAVGAERELCERIVTAVLPHIERAVIQRLIEKLTNTEPGPNWLGYKAWTCDWLRAEMEGGGE